MPALGTASAHHDHGVEFYDSDSSLVDAVVGYVQPAVTDGVAVLVATPEHRTAFVTALAAAGVDPAAAVTAGRLVVLDARETLDQFLVDDAPDPTAFRTVLDGVLDDAAAIGGPVRVYGEMVTLLWQAGQVTAAMALEEMWNDVAATRSFGLLCGYPSALFTQSGSPDDFAALCAQHSAITLPGDQEQLTRLAARGREARPKQERAVRWWFPAARTSGAGARIQLRELFASWGIADMLDEAELLATELVNNAVLHAGSRALVAVSRRDDAVRVEVTDGGAGAFHRLEAELDDTRGRGLMLVEALSAAWGTTIEGASKTVWFELRADCLT